MDAFNDGEGPTEAELQEFAGDVEMEPEEEAEVPAEGKGKAPDREAEVPQAAAAVFSHEEGVVSGGSALPVGNSVEPAAQPCGRMWVGDPKSCQNGKRFTSRRLWPRRLLTRLGWCMEIILYIPEMILAMQSITSRRSGPG